MFPAEVVAIHPTTVTIEYWDTLTPCQVIRTPDGKMLVPGPPKHIRRRVVPEALQSLESWKQQGRPKLRNLIRRRKRRRPSDSEPGAAANSGGG